MCFNSFYLDFVCFFLILRVILLVFIYSCNKLVCDYLGSRIKWIFLNEGNGKEGEEFWGFSLRSYYDDIL